LECFDRLPGEGANDAVRFASIIAEGAEDPLGLKDLRGFAPGLL
jgi:hypothetical protein